MWFRRNVILSVLFSVIIVITLALTIFASHQSQDNRQHAAGTSLYPANIDYEGISNYGNYNPAALTNPNIGAVDISLNWAQVEPQEGVFNWGPADKVMADWSKAGKKFTMVVRFANEGGSCSTNQLTPTWELAKIPSFCDTDYGNIVPDYFNATFKSDWKAYVQAIGIHIANSPYKNNLLYVRIAVGLGGEGFPLSRKGDYQTVDLPQLVAWGYTPTVWAVWQEEMLTSYKNSIPFTTIIYPLNGLDTDPTTGKPVQVEVAEWAAPQGFGLGQQGLQPGTNLPIFQQLRSQYPNIFIQYQTIYLLSQNVTPTCDITCVAQTDIQAAETNGAQFVEWYSQDITNPTLQQYFQQWQQYVDSKFGDGSSTPTSLPPNNTPSPTQPSQQISYHVSAKNILDQNGNILIPYGIGSGILPAEPNWRTNGFLTYFTQNMMQATHDFWHSNTTRIQVGSTALFAKSPYDAAYLAAIDQQIAWATQLGMNTILTYQNEGAGNTRTLMPTQDTINFWNIMAPHYANNQRVFFDVFNEPSLWTGNVTQSWDIWQKGGTYNGTVYVGMQQLVDSIRGSGAQNLIFAEGLASGESLQGLVSGEGTIPHLLTGSNIVYAIHPYFNTTQHHTPAEWDQWFGNAATIGNFPVVNDEWNSYESTKGECLTDAPIVVPQFLSYLKNHNIGLIGYGNWPGTLIRGWDMRNPTAYTGTTTLCDVDTSIHPNMSPNAQGAGQLIQQYLAANNPQSITPTPLLSASPTPTQTGITGTPTPGNSVSFFLTICPHGLGDCGDNVNPTSGGNTNPLHTTRNITLTLTDANNNQVSDSPFQGQVTYVSAFQNFHGTVTIPNLSSGQYLITVKMLGFLSRQIPGIISVTHGQQITLPPVSLVTGDIGPVPGTNNTLYGDNQLDITDYNVLISCFGTKMTTSSCLNPPTQQYPGVDINDDSVVDGADYNEFLRELSVQTGQ